MKKEAMILLVEDNQMDIELTLDAFEQAQCGNDVQVVQTGQEALDYLFGRGQYADRQKYPLPDLILLDLNLPGISGHKVLGQLKSAPGLKRIPVIVLTSSKEPPDLSRCYDLGTNSYLVKPVSFEGFLNVVRTIKNYWFTLNVEPPAALPVED